MIISWMVTWFANTLLMIMFENSEEYVFIAERLPASSHHFATPVLKMFFVRLFVLYF